jgi:O-succinylbenzoic acid--CoA ligase
VAGRDAAGLLRDVAAALDGRGPALAPVSEAEETAAHGPRSAGTAAPSTDAPAPTAPTAPTARPWGYLPAEVDDEVAALVRTSGSTGGPRGVLLDAAALLASAAATHERLGGPGRWLLALPARHVAGLQVLVRSVLTGVEPVLAPPGDIAAVAAAAAGARYAALVPAQLHRALAATGPDGRLPEALAPLARLDAILVGGAATPPDVLTRARAAGLRVVTTYGSTETCGGCVYDGVPLPGVELAVEDDTVLVGGPTLARGYVGGGPGFEVRGGRRWFRTSDLARLEDGPDGPRLVVLGRRDDVLVVGGAKVVPQEVEAALAAVPGVGRACVVGVPSERWGVEPVAVVVPCPGTVPTLEAARAAVTRTLGRIAAPRRLLLVERLPELGPGKVDRAAVARLAAAPHED